MFSSSARAILGRLSRRGAVCAFIAAGVAASAQTSSSFWQRDAAFAPALQSLNELTGEVTSQPWVDWVEQQPDGKIIAGGILNFVNGVTSQNPFAFVRFNSDGTTDTSFTAAMAATAALRLERAPSTDILGRRYVIQSNGTLGRLTTAGEADPTFQSTARVMLNSPVAVRPPFAPMSDRGVVLITEGTYYGSFTLVRLREDGSADPEFAPLLHELGGFSSVMGLVPLPDGRVLVYGSQSTQYGNVMRFVRLNRTGGVDYVYAAGAGNSTAPSLSDAFALAGVLYDLLADSGAPAGTRVQTLLAQGDLFRATIDVVAGGPAVIASRSWSPGGTSFARYRRTATGNLTIDARPTLLTQSSEPASVIPGNRLVLTATAGGLEPLTYQWLKNGVPIPGATASAHWIQSFQPELVGSYTLLVSNPHGWAITRAKKLTLNTAEVPLAITTPLSDQNAVVGQSVTLSVSVSSNPVATFVWTFNGTPISGSGFGSGSTATSTSSTLTLPNVQPANAGVYQVTATDGRTVVTSTAVLGVSSTEKVSGQGAVVGSNIRHPNGNIYDQVQLQGVAATITADPGKVTRISYVDLDDDIVQVEFTGAGALSLVLDPNTASGPAAPANYNQPGVLYMKGHARIVITGANDTTNVTIFTVGPVTALNQSLFRQGVNYGGAAEIASVSLPGSSRDFGGLRSGNAVYIATKGIAGIHAPNVRFAGPVVIGDIIASDSAVPTLLLGQADDVRIAGGALDQFNDLAVQISGVTRLNLVNGMTSHGATLDRQTTLTRFTQEGVDVTPLLMETAR